MTTNRTPDRSTPLSAPAASLEKQGGARSAPARRKREKNRSRDRDRQSTSSSPHKTRQGSTMYIGKNDDGRDDRPERKKPKRRPPKKAKRVERNSSPKVVLDAIEAHYKLTGRKVVLVIQLQAGETDGAEAYLADDQTQAVYLSPALVNLLVVLKHFFLFDTNANMRTGATIGLRSAVDIAKEMGIDGMRANLGRLRKAIRELGIDPDEVLIENRPRRGYRMRDDVAIANPHGDEIWISGG